MLCHIVRYQPSLLLLCKLTHSFAAFHLQKNIVPVNASGSAFAKLVQEQLQNMHGDLSVDTSPSTYTCTANDGDACGAQHWNKTSGDLPEMTAFNDFLLHTRNTHRGSRYGALLFSGDDSKSDNETHTRQTMDDFNFTVFVNASLIHASPIYINLVHQAILKTKVKHARINVRNFPLPLTKRQVELSKGLNSFFAALMIMVSFSFLPASYAIFVVKEREVKAKHQQNVSGVSMTAYWLSTFVWDSVSSLIPSGLTLLLFRCFGIDAFVEGEAGVACALLFFLFGPAVAAFTYCISFVFASHSTAQNIVLFLNFVTGLILMIVNFVLNQVDSTRDVNQHLKNLYRLFPGFCLADGMAQLSFCVHDKCLNNGDIFHLLSPMDWNVCGGHIVFLTCEAVLYFMLCMLIEYLHLYPAFAAFCAGRGCANEASLITDEMVAPEAPEDEDVINERTRVSSGGANSDIIRLHNFRKVYPGGCTGRPDKMAVKSLDFGIKGGECFGFLGTNGAGKTTTLSILRYFCCSFLYGTVQISLLSFL
jgi:ATP-binding cassette subfamily A (ABC1) protein 3